METIIEKSKVFVSYDNSGSNIIVTPIGTNGNCYLYYSHMLAPKSIVTSDSMEWAYGNIYGFIDDFCKENGLELLYNWK